MQTPPIPENEQDRLKEIEKYHLRTSLSNESLEGILYIASTIFKMPVNLISIVDKEKQFFKVKKGIEIDETSRDVSFCAHAINKPDELMIIPDATKDERFRNNPFVTNDPSVRFYAGIPIKSPNNIALGTLCVIDYKPNHLSEEQQEALRHLGKQVTLILELQNSNQQLKKNEELLIAQANDMEDYAHIIAHDLKEPVRMIKSFLDLFTKKYGNQIEDKGKHYIELASEGTDRMNKLIEDLLSFAKKSRVRGNLKKSDLNLIVEEALNHLDFLIKEKDATIEIENTLPTIEGIPEALCQLFFNILQNAIKFVPGDKKPLIRISAEDNKSFRIVRITDNGIGIPENQFEHIFKIFRRLENKSETPGTGIGLTIVKKIADIHQIRVEIRSEIDVGTTFLLYLPT